MSTTESEKKDIVMAKGKLEDAVIIIAIISLTAIIYSNTLSSPFVFDDIQNIAENPEIKNLSNFLDISGSRYIGYLSFAINYNCGGLNTSVYHLTNIIIHIINGILVYMLVKLTFKTPQISRLNLNNSHSAVFIPIAASLIFVSHPIQTQAVTYIVQRFASMAALFYLSALVLYIKARLCLFNLHTVHGQTSLSLPPSNPQPATRNVFNLKHVTFYTLSLFSVILAMKTKEISFTLPFIIILYEFTFITSPKDASVSTFLRLLPFLVALLIIPLGKIDAFMHEDLKPLSTTPEFLSKLEYLYLDKTSLSLPRREYLLTQFRVIITYTRLLLFPVNQNLDYDYPVYSSIFQAEVLISWLFLLSIFAAAVYSYFSQKSSCIRKFMVFGIFWFFITLSIESSFPIREVIFEHRLYLPSIGVFMIFSSAMYYLPGQLEKRGYYIALAVIIFFLSIAAYKRNIVWESGQSLWADAVDKSPNKARSHNSLGTALKNQGRFREAIVHYTEALRLKPDHVEAHNNIGMLLFDLGNLEKAIINFNKALQIKPDFFTAHNNLGIALFKQGKTEDAMIHYREALKIKPDFDKAHYNMAIALEKQGRPEDAVVHYTKALKINPDYAEAYYNLGNILFGQGKFDEAVKRYYEALKAKPDNPDVYNNMGAALLQQGKFEKAITSFSEALRINPDLEAAQRNLDLALQKIP